MRVLIYNIIVCEWSAGHLFEFHSFPLMPAIRLSERDFIPLHVVREYLIAINRYGHMLTVICTQFRP